MLLSEMAKAARVKDDEVHGDVATGFELVGQCKFSGDFPAKAVPAASGNQGIWKSWNFAGSYVQKSREWLVRGI